MEDYMGCENWLLLQIGRIAALHELKTQAQVQQINFDCEEFGKTVADIGNEIQTGLAKASFAQCNTSDLDAMFLLPAPKPSVLVTMIFAYMATIYLHLVLHGFGNLDAIESTISETMRMLHTRIPEHLLRALVASLYVIANVARREDEQYFRHVFETPPLQDPLLKHRGRIVPILEEIWKRRQTNPGLSWRESLGLTDNILLL